MLDSGLATAYRNGTYCNKGRRDGKLSKDQHGAQLKESKELLISKNVSPPQCYPIKTQDHWAVNPGLFLCSCCKPNRQKELFPLAINENNDILLRFRVNGAMTVKCVFDSLMWVCRSDVVIACHIRYCSIGVVYADRSARRRLKWVNKIAVTKLEPKSTWMLRDFCKATFFFFLI